MARVRIAQLFRPAFWLNFAASLLLTLWIPIVHIVVRDDKGNILQQTTSPAYSVYLNAFQNPTMWSLYKYIGAHLAIVFGITTAVWIVVLLLRREVPSVEPVAEAPASES